MGPKPVLAGPALLQNYDAELGLELNLAKCKLFGPEISEFSSSAYDIIPKVPLSEGTVFLGVPIGSDSFMEKPLDESVKETRNSDCQSWTVEV